MPAIFIFRQLQKSFYRFDIQNNCKLAKKDIKKESPKKIPPPTTDLTTWYSGLSYFPPEYKESRLWMAQMLYFAKNNSQVLQDEVKAKIYRDTDELKINEGELMRLIDPPTPKSKGGEAKYFSSDRKAMPIDAHLDNILEEDTLGEGINITCRITDPIVKLQEQKDKEKIIYQNWVRNIVNELMAELGLPKMKSGEDPYKFIQKFNTKDSDKSQIDTVGDTIDQIRTKIKDDDGMRIFMANIYKNGIELAFEVGIKYYMVDQNEFLLKYAHDFFRDLKHFNKFCGRAAVDEMTGQRIIRYYDPTQLYTNPFKDKNGDDILYWYYEEDVTFADFERLVGADMTYEEKEKALKLQKGQGWNWGNVQNSSSNNSTKVRVGFFSVLTQDSDTFSQRYINDTTTSFTPEEPNWKPDDEAGVDRKIRTYNVWQTCYYLPINILQNNRNSAINWQEQSKYIFHVRKEIDMMRFGKDGRYTKSSLVVWNDSTRPSWTDIKQAYMPKINMLWQQFQNCIIQDVDAVAMSNDLLMGMANAVDEANAKDDGGAAQIEQWKMVKQAGQGFFKFTDKNGAPIADPSKLFISVKNGMMEKAEKCLLRIMDIYNVMTQSLAKGQAGEGLQPKARTATAGIEIANNNANKASSFLKKSYSEGVVVGFAQRFAQHIHTICKEKTKYNYAERWKIFNDVIGRYNGAVLEGIEDINFENIGLTIENKDDAYKRDMVLRTIMEKYAQQKVSTAGLSLAIGTDNWKLQLVELALEEEKADEKAQKALEEQRQHEMELKKMDLQIAQALEAAKTQGKDQNIMTEGKVEAMVGKQLNDLKAQTMKEQKEQLLHNKLVQDAHKAELTKDQKTHQANIEQQAPLV